MVTEFAMPTRHSAVLATSERSEDSLASAKPLRDKANEPESLPEAPLEVAQEVWESIREEFYERESFVLWRCFWL